MSVTTDNKKAHECLKAFHKICDEYNEHGLLNEDYLSKTGAVSLARVTQSMTIEALDLFKYLKAQEDCEATRAYITFARKILLRLSYVIAHGRRETEEEAKRYWRVIERGEKEPIVTVVDAYDFDLRLVDGTLYRITCSRSDIDKLIALLGDENVADCEEV